MRAYGRFTTSIYGSEEFRALTFEQQGVYYMLGLQGEISAAGTLPLRLRRWSRNAAGASTDSLSAALDSLVELGHIVVDEDTEELLITKFVKWDGGYANTKRLPVIADSAVAIQSPKLRARLAQELAKLGLSDLAARLTDTQPDALSDSPSDAVTRFDRVVVTDVLSATATHNPQSATREPQPGVGEDLGGHRYETFHAPLASEPPKCTAHANLPPGADEPACFGCKKAREAWQEARVAAALASAAARANCPDCLGSGWIEDADGNPAAKCNHRGAVS